MRDTLQRFRIFAISEGVSYVLLVFIGMPLKYLAGQPLMVEIVGWIHGVLFMAYLFAGVSAAAEYEWSRRFCGWAFLAALVPGGTFVLDRNLRDETDPSPEQS